MTALLLTTNKKNDSKLVLTLQQQEQQINVFECFLKQNKKNKNPQKLQIQKANCKH